MPQEAACGGREVTAGATRPPESSSAGSTASGGQRGLRLGEGRQETEGASQGTTQHLEVTVGGGVLLEPGSPEAEAGGLFQVRGRSELHRETLPQLWSTCALDDVGGAWNL